MSEFSYLAEKITAAKFIADPFTHVTIENFMTEEHFRKIIESEQVKIAKPASSEALLQTLEERGYRVKSFPGCVTSKKEYLDFLKTRSLKRELINGTGRDIIEGYGLTMRLKDYSDNFLKELVDYLNGEEFLTAIKNKFDITDEIYIETAIQKNLDGYEISPHPDIRKKALTYMVNIYTDERAESESVHTHLLKFRPTYSYVSKFWENNPKVDTCWVPWDWCETVKVTNRNNSVTIFSPGFDTMHAVRLDYDHLSFQRNQIYGNLWYKSRPARGMLWSEIDLVTPRVKGPAHVGSTQVASHPSTLLEALKQQALVRTLRKSHFASSVKRRATSLTRRIRDRLDG